jgi:hypothetical protein
VLGLLSSALRDCFWLPLVILWFLVDKLIDDVTTYFLSKAFELENPMAMETLVNRVSALFIAGQRAFLVAAALHALCCGCGALTPSDLLRAIVGLQWDAASASCVRLTGGDCCMLHFVVAVAFLRCCFALKSSYQTLMSYVRRGKVWQWVDTMVWLTDSTKSSNPLLLALVLLWWSRWRFTVALVAVYELASIGDALLSVAISVLTPQTVEEQMGFTVSWWHLLNAAWKVAAAWTAFSLVHDGADDSWFPLVCTLLLLMLSATLLRSVFTRLQKKAAFD